MLKGVRGSDSRLRSIQLSPRKSISSDNPYWKKRVDWNFVYTYYVTYKAVGEAYERRNPVMPALFGEGSYENGGLDMNAGPDVIRRQAAWALTSGSPGEFTGQEGVWDFQQGWKKKLDTRSAVQLKSVRDLFESLKGWSRLVPDTGHGFVTSGRGRRITTDAAVWPKSNDYVTAARSRRGSLAVIYVPSARTITVDMARMRSGPSATWVDPTNGTRRRTKPDGTFRTPGRNAAGAGDWLLVLRA